MMQPASRGGWPVWFIVAVLGSFTPEGQHASAAEETKGTAPFQGHISTVACLAITPDGRTLATGSFDNDIKLWDLATGKERTTLRGHPGGVCEVAFTPDGNLLASTSNDEFVILWDETTGREIRRIPTGYRVGCLAFSPDGRTVITGGEGPIKIWDVAAGTERATLDRLVSKADGRPLLCLSMAVKADGKTLCAGHADGLVRFWDLTTGKVRATLRVGKNLVDSVVLSPGDWTLGCVIPFADIILWDFATGRQRARMRGDQAKAWTLAFSPDGQTLASGGMDGKIRLWDAVSGEPRAVFQAHDDWRVHALAFTPDGKTLISGGGAQMKRGEVKLWDVSAFGKPSATGSTPPSDRRASIAPRP